MYKPNEREYRSFSTFQSEERTGGLLVLCGTPVVFNTPTILYEENGVQYKEIIDPRFFDGCDMSDFIFNRNHGMNDGTVYARTKNGSLRYTILADRVDFEADLDVEDERHRNLYRDVQKKLIDKMSFAFVCFPMEDGGWRYDPETHTRTLLRAKKMYDVSAVDFPAYNDTSITTARSFFTEESRKEIKALEERRRRQQLIIKTLI